MKTRIGPWCTLGTRGKASGPANRANTALVEVTGQRSGGDSSATGFSSQLGFQVNWVFKSSASGRSHLEGATQGEVPTQAFGDLWQSDVWVASVPFWCCCGPAEVLAGLRPSQLPIRV